MNVMATPRPMASTRAGKGAGAPRAVPRLSTPFGAPVQTKLKLGPVSDHFERQADSAAAHVTGGRAGAPILSGLPMGGGTAQRACAACAEKEKEGQRIQRKCACGADHGEPCGCHDKKDEEHPELQIDRARKHDDARAEGAISAVQSVVSGGGRPLPDPVRHQMESGFGRDFGHVRIHDSPRAAASAEGIGAHAYTVGNHIAFNRGQYQPQTDSGRFLLAHELAHTVQQAGAPPAKTARISQPGDTHETQANRAAHAATTGAPMPALTSGTASVSRYSLEEFGDDLVSAGEAVIDAPGQLYDGAVDLAGDAVDAVIDFGSEIYQTAVAIADQLGVHVRIDGTTLVIAFDEFDPCSLADLSLEFRLSDIGLDPTLYFPLGPPLPFFTVGVFTLAGMAGVSLNLDPGMGITLEQCSFGPGEIRINALTASASISGQLSMTTAMMNQLGADLSLRLDTIGIIAWPAPPIVLAVPLIGLEFGGAMEFMMQSASDYTARFSASVSLGGASGAFSLDNDVGFAIDMSYGLFGAVSILGQDVCRLGWPLDSWHEEMSANVQIAAAASLSASGLSFSFAASASPLGSSPLDDLGFAFDESRMDDDCWLCDFLIENDAMPSQNGYTWTGNVGNYPLLGGPEPDIYQRDPSITSGALCRGTCGADCADGSCDGERRDLVVCENAGEGHIWHTYVGYETCGSHQGCRDHDACYDMMADTIWGFGGFMIGPGYRACDLDAVCQHGFQTSVGWAGGGGPYDQRLRYADYAYSTPGCHGPCPPGETLETGEEAYGQTCLTDRVIWPGISRSRHWSREFLNEQLFHGFVEVPYIIGVHYGVNALAQLDADVGGQIGPFTLRDACLDYDPTTMSYTGRATLDLFLNARASASITAALEGFLSDFLCLLNWLTIRGTMNAGITAQLPSNLSATVELYCENGELTIMPSARFRTCLDIFGQISAGIEVFFLGMNMWAQEWPLVERQLVDKCWQMELTFDPFVMGEMPDFRFMNRLGLDLDMLLGELFEPAGPVDLDRQPARNPLRGIRFLFPCLDDDPGEDDDDDVEDNRSCDRKATTQDAHDWLTEDQMAPKWPGGTRSMRVPGRASTTVGVQMEAEYLTLPAAGGSEPSSNIQKDLFRHPGLPTSDCFKPTVPPAPGKKKPPKSKNTQFFIKGHLLNHNIGGPAKVVGQDEKNLFPITGGANSEHHSKVEKDVKKRVDAGDVLYYRVTVADVSGPTAILNSAPPNDPTGFYEVSSTLVCEVADYNFCTDNSFKRNAVTLTPIRSEFQFIGYQPFDQIADPAQCPS